jgi:hypothetical protein
MMSYFSGRNRPRIASWFSCGTASAVTAKIALTQYRETHEVVVARCIVPEEHPDNDRFAADVAEWLGQEIVNLRATEYASCEDVWTRRRFMASQHGAVCTREMKKAVRWAFERDWRPDFQAFGYTADEQDRADGFRAQNPDVRLLTPLIDQGLKKEDCHAIITRAGLELPAMYRLGFPNANCIGCVQASSPTYWNRTRRLFSDVFDRRAKLSRELGVRLVRMTTGARERIFLDELDPALDNGDMEPAMECGLLCYATEQLVKAP